MPRTPNKPPEIIKIELLSSGVDPRQVDDITGEALPQPLARPPKIASADQVIDSANKAKAAKHKRVLQMAGMIAGDPVPYCPPGQMIVKIIDSATGPLVITKPKPPFRRV